MGGSSAVLVLTTAAAFQFGMAIVLLSCLKGHLAARLGVSEQRLAGLWAGMNLALVPLIFLCGLLIDANGMRWVVLFGSLLASTSLFVLMSTRRFKGVVFAYFGISVGGAAVSAASIVLMPRAFFGPDEAAASLNLGSVFFALGALVTPALVDVLLRAIGYTRTLSVMATAFLAPAVLVLFIGGEFLESDGQPDLRYALSTPLIWFAALVFFVYAPIEGCLHTWGARYLQDTGHDPRRAARLLTGFWLFFLLGRLAAAYLQHVRWLPKTADPWVMVVLAFVALGVLGNMVGAARTPAAGKTLLLFGFCLGPIFPTLVGMLFGAYTGGQGTAFGVVFAVGSAGSLLFGPIIETRCQRSSGARAMGVPLLLTILLLLTTVIYGLAWRERHDDRDGGQQSSATRPTVVQSLRATP